MSVFIQIDLPDRTASFKRRSLTVKGTYPDAALEQLDAAYREARDWLEAQGARPAACELHAAGLPSPEELAEAARKVHRVRPGVPTHVAAGVVESLLVMGWRPAVPDNSEKGAGDG